MSVKIEFSTHPFAVMSKHGDGSQGIIGHHRTLKAAQMYLTRRSKVDPLEQCVSSKNKLKVKSGVIIVYYWIISLDCVG